MPAWERAGVVGPCGRQPKTTNRAAEHSIPADRFARAIVRFLTVSAVRARHLNAKPLDRSNVVVITRQYIGLTICYNEPQT